MSLETELAAAEGVARGNLARSLSLEAALQQIESDLSRFLKGDLRQIPQRAGPASDIYARLHDIGKTYREMESIKKYLPVQGELNQAGRWFEYGRRLAHTGAPGHAHDFLWKAFYATLPTHYRMWGRLLLFTSSSVFSFAGDKELRLKVGSELVPVLYRVGEKWSGDRLAAQMMQLVAEGTERVLVRRAHLALAGAYLGMKNERFAEYHVKESQKE